MRTRSLARLSAVITLVFAISQAAAAASFTDISGSANLDAIEYLHAKGVIGGYSDGTFRPGGQINRAELAKILAGAGGEIPNSEQYHGCFSDVGTEWFAAYVCYAKAKGWVAGYSDGTFRPGNPVNTAEALKMILNAQNIQLAEGMQLAGYTDVDQQAWYAGFVARASSHNLLWTTGGRLGVGDNITRGLVAEVIYRAMVINASGAVSFGIDDQATPPLSSSSSEPAAMERKYKDGTYSATGNYNSPSGSEQVQVSLTLKSGVVTDSTYKGMAQFGRSQSYQQAFGDGYKEQVVGKSIDQISLDIVNGSSLTPRGFMDAVAKIKAEAKA